MYIMMPMVIGCLTADNTPVEYCATYEIDVTTDNQIFKIELVDIQKKKSKGK